MAWVQVGDDEYAPDPEHAVNAEEKKKDLGALEAAKMAIKFLDQVCTPAPRSPRNARCSPARGGGGGPSKPQALHWHAGHCKDAEAAESYGPADPTRYG
jgi:hypothetical protein